ncbi:transglycosylase family protein [Streptomyces niveus]|uniref:transglycosylase family protein n=1 Tax=Streptomyces niveus TaxID=193462 RepID=UPI0036C1E955
MRSGNGRHRRPRQAPALVVAAGVTGSAIAIPLLGASGAGAADASTWDRVAQCESGGIWSADFGNKAFGGLQITQETWADFGGTAYAPTPDQASRSQQIAVAEKILDAQGPGMWPTCALVTDLTADGGAEPDASADSEPSGEATEGKPKAPAKPAPGSSEEAVLPPAPESTPSSGQFGRDSGTTPSTKPDSDAGTGTGTGQGKHRGEAAPEGDATAGPGESAGAPGGSGGSDAPDASTEAGKPGEKRESGRHASRGDGSARDDAAADGSYTVRTGDNLWAIADEQKVEGGWPALYEANREVVGSDADLILPGQSLDLTAK